MKAHTTKPAGDVADEKLFDNWFDPITTGLRAKTRGFTETMIEEELDSALSRPCWAQLSRHDLASRFLLHLPLNRQSETNAREGVEFDGAALAVWLGASVATLDPVLAAIRRHVFAAERLSVDDTTVPMLAKLKTVTCRIRI